VSAIYNISPSDLKHQGIRVILTDLDNTLVAWNNPDGTKELHDWLLKMQAVGITVMVVSNNNRNRIGRALKQLDLPFVSRALKPLPVGINRAVRELGVPKSAVVMVGDQLMTDIWAGNVAGVRTILVKPLIKTDAWNTQFNRLIERFVFKQLEKKQPLTYREDLNGNNHR